MTRLTTQTPTPQWGQAPHWSPLASPVYIDDITRYTLNKHTGHPIIQGLNPSHGYWHTERAMTEAEVKKYFGPAYLANMP